MGVLPSSLASNDPTFWQSPSLLKNNIFNFRISSSCWCSVVSVCNSTDCRLPGSSVHGVSQARILEWIATSYSWGSFQPRIEPMSPVSPALVVGFIMTSTTCISCACLAARVQQFATLWTASSVNWGFSRQEYWNGLPYPPLGDLPNPGIKPRSPTVQVDSLPSQPPRKPKNTGVGSLSLLQGIFPTQELNRDLLHCRRILYQLSYQRSPCISYRQWFRGSQI